MKFEELLACSNQRANETWPQRLSGLKVLTFDAHQLICYTWDTVSAIEYPRNKANKNNLFCSFQSILRSNSPTDLMDTPLTQARPRQVTTDLSIAFLTANTERGKGRITSEWSGRLNGVREWFGRKKLNLRLSIKMTWARFTPQSSSTTRLKNTLKTNPVIFTFFLVLQL